MSNNHGATAETQQSAPPSSTLSDRTTFDLVPPGDATKDAAEPAKQAGWVSGVLRAVRHSAGSAVYGVTSLMPMYRVSESASEPGRTQEALAMTGTSASSYSYQANAAVRALVERAKVEANDLDIAEALEPVVVEYGDDAVCVVGRVVQEGHVHPYLGRAVLRALGLIHDPATIDVRSLVASHALLSSSASLRYGAALAAMRLGSETALAALEQAEAREQITALRSDMRRLLDRGRGAK